MAINWATETEKGAGVLGGGLSKLPIGSFGTGFMGRVAGSKLFGKGKGTSIGGMAGSIIGQKLIPIPYVGSMIGGFIGSGLGKVFGKITGIGKSSKRRRRRRALRAQMEGLATAAGMAASEIAPLARQYGSRDLEARVGQLQEAQAAMGRGDYTKIGNTIKALSDLGKTFSGRPSKEAGGSGGSEFHPSLPQIGLPPLRPVDIYPGQIPLGTIAPAVGLSIGAHGTTKTPRSTATLIAGHDIKTLRRILGGQL